jgi:hypothetical protein
MPVVDSSKNMTQIIGLNYLDVKADNMPSAGDGNGQFRLQCLPTHMSNDDPIVYPNQQGAAHHHTFFGNASVNFRTDPATLASVGNSACMGGIANRSAYWIPSLIDTSNNAPLKPNDAVWYYKTGYIVPPQHITVPPKGLRLIAGNMKATTVSEATVTGFKCTSTNYSSEWGGGKAIPTCGGNNNLVMNVSFPQCWNGRDLDSPNHQDHMAYSNLNLSTFNKCPATHPVAIPHITLNIHWRIPAHNPALRLSSDNYVYNGSNAGYSAHSDWINGWQDEIITSIVKNCLNAGKECHQGLLGDGRGLAWLPYPLR